MELLTQPSLWSCRMPPTTSPDSQVFSSHLKGSCAVSQERHQNPSPLIIPEAFIGFCSELCLGFRGRKRHMNWPCRLGSWDSVQQDWFYHSLQPPGFVCCWSHLWPHHHLLLFFRQSWPQPGSYSSGEVIRLSSAHHVALWRAHNSHVGRIWKCQKHTTKIHLRQPQGSEFIPYEGGTKTMERQPERMGSIFIS